MNEDQETVEVENVFGGEEEVEQSELIPAIDREEWFLQLIDDLKALVVEGEFTARFELVRTYHELGKRVLEENDNFERSKIYGDAIVLRVAQAIGKSERTVYNALAFYKKFPNLDELPEGKNTSWSKICKQLLPTRTEDVKEAPIIIEDRNLLRDCINDNMDYMMEYAEPTEKGYKFFIPRKNLVSFYERLGRPIQNPS